MRTLSLAVLSVLLAGTAWSQDGGDFGDFVTRAKKIPVPEAAPLQKGGAKKYKKPPFFAGLPERFTAAADDPLQTALFDAAVDRGKLDWYDVSRETEIGGKLYKVTIAVSNALKIDGVRINMRYDFAQKLADKLGYVLPTMTVAEMVGKQAAVKFTQQSAPMQEHVVDGTNTTVTAMVKHSALVDEQVNGRAGLANNEGKWFILTKKCWVDNGGKQKSGIYGWWADDGSLIQPRSLFHELQFADYSQVVRFMAATATIKPDGGTAYSVSTAKLLTGDVSEPALAKLISDEGVLAEARHPSVPKAP